MMIKANVILDYSKWKNKIKDPENYLEKKLKKLSKKPYFKKKKQEFSILLTNNKKMKNLNFKFRKKNKPTDVLSFQSNDNIYIGDIAISYEIVNKRSKLSNFFIEFDKMWIHGYFHLIGYDHKKLKDFKKMAKKENLILNYFHNSN
jgi:probable rRNA maturation factor